MESVVPHAGMLMQILIHNVNARMDKFKPHSINVCKAMIVAISISTIITNVSFVWLIVLCVKVLLHVIHVFKGFIMQITSVKLALLNVWLAHRQIAVTHVEISTLVLSNVPVVIS